MPETDAREYLDAVNAALANPALVAQIAKYLTQRCPECRQHTRDMSERDLEAHTLVVPDAAYVVIGCEGYLVINPNLLGIDYPNCQDWLDDLPGTDDTPLREV